MALPNQQEPDEIEEPQESAAPAVKREPTVRTEDDGSVSVDLGDEKPTAQDRKSRRGGRQAEEVERYRALAETTQRELAELRAQTAAGFQSVNQRVQQPEDPFKRRIANIRAEQESIQAAIKSTQMSEAELNQRRTRFYELNDEADDIREQRIVDRATREAQRVAQPQAGAGEEAILKSEFPDVVGNPQALGWAAAHYRMLVAEGKTPSLALQRQSMQKAAENPLFNLRQPAAPPPATPTQQQRYGAVPGQAGVNGGSGEFRLETWQKKLAVSRWPEVEENVAYARFAKLMRDQEREERRQTGG